MGVILSTSRTPEVLRELGARFRRTRLLQNLRIEDLAREAGVGVATVTRLERGQSVGLEYVARILRGLGRLAALDSFLADPDVSPLDLAGRGGVPRKRASGRKDG